MNTLGSCGITHGGWSGKEFVMEDLAVEATEFADLDIVDLDLPVDEELAAVSVGGLGNTEVGASGIRGRSFLI